MTQQLTTKLNKGRLAIAQEAYNTAQNTGWTANPYRFKDQRASWLAHGIGIYFHNSGRTCPHDISGRGYHLEVNNRRFVAKIVTDDNSNVTGIAFERD